MSPAAFLLGFLKAHWRPVAVLAALGLAFAAGRFSNPPKVTTVTQEKVVYRDRVVTQVVHEQGTDRVVYRDRTVIRHPDGTVEQRDVQRTEKKTESQTSTRTAESKATEKSESKSKVVEAAKPQWHASALGGVDFRHLSDAPFAFGAHVEHRVEVFHIPGWVGVWGVSTGTAGVSIGLEF